MESCNIKVYALSTCIHCKNAREFLDKCGTEYDCIEVDKLVGEERKNILEEVKRINQNCSFPTLIIGDKVIIGFRPEEIKEALNL